MADSALAFIAAFYFGMGGWTRRPWAQGPEGLLPTGMHECKHRVPTPPSFKPYANRGLSHRRKGKKADQ